MERIGENLWLNVEDLDESKKFFIEAWLELTDMRTHESYRPRVMNLKNILKELILYLDGCIKGQWRFKRYVDEIVAETRDILGKENILLENHPLLLAELENILNNLNNFSNTKNENISSYYENLVVLRRIYFQLSSWYKEKIIKHLKQSIIDKDNRHILRLTSMLLTELIAEGHSIKHLYFCRRPLLEWEDVTPEKKKDFNSRFQKVISNLSDSKKWTVFLKLYSNEPFKIDFPNHNGVKFLNSINPSLEWKRIPCEFEEIHRQTRYARVTVEASDPHRATLKARDKVEDILDSIVFTIANQHIEIFHKAFLPHDQGLEESTLRQLHEVNINTRHSFEELTELMDMISNNNKISKESYERFKASLRFYRMGVTTNSNHVSFINLWTSIEYLITGNSANYNHTSLQNILATCLSVRYVPDLLNDLRGNFIRMGVEFEDVSWELCEEIEILNLLRDEKKLNNLTRTLEAYSLLLKYRTEELAGNLKTNENIIQFIEKHRQRLLWHISRLYRTRNVIAHEAGNVDVTLMLPHIEKYNFLIIDTVAEFINKSEGLTSLDDIFMRIVSWYKVVIKELSKNNDAEPIVNFMRYLI